jgi:hypothetical protein
MATAAMIAGSAAGGGGLTAFTVGLFRRKILTSKIPKPSNAEEVHYVDEHDRSRAPETGDAG